MTDQKTKKKAGAFQIKSTTEINGLPLKKLCQMSRILLTELELFQHISGPTHTNWYLARLGSPSRCDGLGQFQFSTPN